MLPPSTAVRATLGPFGLTRPRPSTAYVSVPSRPANTSLYAASMPAAPFPSECTKPITLAAVVRPGYSRCVVGCGVDAREGEIFDLAGGLAVQGGTEQRVLARLGEVGHDGQDRLGQQRRQGDGGG